MGLCRRWATKTRVSHSILIEQSLKDYKVLNGYLVARGQKNVDKAKLGPEQAATRLLDLGTESG